jgi:hypothetical protein
MIDPLKLEISSIIKRILIKKFINMKTNFEVGDEMSINEHIVEINLLYSL